MDDGTWCLMLVGMEQSYKDCNWMSLGRLYMVSIDLHDLGFA